MNATGLIEDGLRRTRFRPATCENAPKGRECDARRALQPRGTPQEGSKVKIMFRIRGVQTRKCWWGAHKDLKKGTRCSLNTVLLSYDKKCLRTYLLVEALKIGLKDSKTPAS